eukprot:tig00000507_g1784.t1
MAPIARRASPQPDAQLTPEATAVVGGTQTTGRGAGPANAGSSADIAAAKRQVVANIASEFFASERLAKMTQNMLTTISKDLYSGSAHFVHEVIQNGEDNSYPPGSTPSLIFKLWRDPAKCPEGVLAIINNETGFDEKNVQAICTVGESTKKHRKEDGFIGEKGMGFKSVFVVSRAPEIYSNGYQFFLDEEPDAELGFGYVVPTWKEGDAPDVVKAHPGQTVILLPLKRGKYVTVAAGLQELHASLFVGLTKLERIVVDIQGASACCISVDRSTPGMLALSSRRGRSVAELLSAPPLARPVRVFIYDEMRDVPAHISEPKREGVTRRPFRIAIPLVADPDVPLAGCVFAYLPTDVPSGMPFAINADWLLSASRETIHEPRGNAWNAWLISELPGVFVRGFMQLLQDERHRFGAYASVPLQSTSMFAGVREHILRELKGAQCVICEDGHFRRPAQVLIGPPALYDLFRKYGVPPKLAARPLVAKQVVTEGRHAALEALRALGVRDFGEGEYMEMLRDGAWIGAQQPAFFLQLYDLLMPESRRWPNPAGLAGKLRPLGLVPLAEAPAGDAAPFLCLRPADGGSHALALLQSVEACEALRGVLPVAHPHRAILDARAKDDVLRRWLEDVLGLVSFSFAAYIDELAVRLGGQRTLAGPTLLQITSFIREKWAARSECITENARSVLRARLPLLFESGLRGTAASSSYISAEEARSWRDFFEKVLGVPRVPRFPSSAAALNPFELPAPVERALSSCIASIQRAKRKSILISQPRIPSWLAEEKAAGTAVTADHNARVTAFLQWIVALPGSVKDVQNARIEWSYTPQSRDYAGVETTTSDLWSNMQRLHWFPATTGLQKPGQVYLSEDPEIDELLGDERPCVAVDVPPALAPALGFRTSESKSLFNDIKRRLQQLSEEGVLSTADYVSVRKIYAFLLRRVGTYGAEHVQAFFASKRVIYVPAGRHRWLKSSEVMWPRVEETAGREVPSLSEHYGAELKPFFVDVLGVREHLDDEFYADRWTALARRPVPEGPDARKTLERGLAQCYRRLAEIARGEERPDWWEDWVASAPLYTGKAFVSAEERECVVVPDQGHIELLFADQLQFAWYPPDGTLGEFKALFAALGLRLLSGAVRPILEAESLNPLARVRPGSKLTRELKELVCQLLKNEFPGVFERARGNGNLERAGPATPGEKGSSAASSSLAVEWRYAGADGDVDVADPDCVVFFDEEGGTVWWRAKLSSKGRAIVTEDPEELMSQMAREVCACVNHSFEDAAEHDTLESKLTVLFTMAPIKRAVHARQRKWVLPEAERAWVAALLDDAEQSLRETEAAESNLADAMDADYMPDAPDLATVRKRKRRGSGGAGAGGSGGAGGAGAGKENAAGAANVKKEPAEEEAEEGAPPLKAARGRLSDSPTGFAVRRVTDLEAEADEEEGEGALDPSERLALKEAALELALEYELACKREPRRLAAAGTPACDLESRECGDLERRIEVQALRGAWGPRGVALAFSQLHPALVRGDKYWVYVVEHAGDPARRRLHALRNPVKNMTELRVDGGWRKFAADSYPLPGADGQALALSAS